jgi:hypothetical protein
MRNFDESLARALEVGTVLLSILFLGVCVTLVVIALIG